MSRLVVIVAAVLAVLGSAFATPTASAAGTGLTLTADARYVVDPGKHRVHVAVAITVTNHRSDTKTRRYFFDRAYLAVQPGTTAFKVASAGTTPTVHVARKAKTYTLLRIDFGKRLGAGQSRRLNLAFDIPDPGGAATRTTRIGSSLVSFGAWGFGATGSPGGGVTVVFPKGYAVEVDAPALKAPTTDSAGNTVYSTGPLASPLSFFAYFIADRPSAYKETTLEVDLGGATVPIAIRAWPDDPAWAKRVTSLLKRGLPALAKDIGLPWPVDGRLVVSEALSRSSAGFSGRYDPQNGQIDIAYYASPTVILHEAAHAWFDGSLLADRWANEGFATYYALRAAAAIGEKHVTAPKLTKELEAVRVPLNAWAAPVPGAAPSPVEDAEYAASFRLASLIGARATPAKLQTVWAAIRESRAAYQPTGPSASLETIDGAPDWRGLLDILEDRTGSAFVDLWRTWVVRPGEDALLDQRAATQARYAAVLARAEPWSLPRVVRDSLRVWQFEAANELLDSASTALDDRDAVFAAAAGAGLQPPSTMETDFESPRGFAVTSAEADAEIAAINAYREAATTKPQQPSLFHQVGLWNSDPSAAMGAAAAAFSAGDLRGTVQSAAFAKQIWTGAGEIGRNRLVAIVLSLAALIVGAFVAIRWYRDRHSRRRWYMARPS